MNPLLNEFTYAPVVSFSNGQIINQKNTKNEACIYCIRFGFVKEYTISNSGDESILVILCRNDIFPLVSILNENGGSQKLYFEALGKVKLLQLTKKQLLSELETDMELATAVMVQLGQRFLTSGQHTENLLGKSAHQKLVYCLQFLAFRYGHKDGDTVFLDPVFTHKLIASTIGLTRGTVTREFEVLRTQKLITTHNRRITIPSMRALSKEFGVPFTLADF